MSTSNWMLHRFHNLEVDTDCRTAPKWYYDLAERLHLEFEGESFLALYSAINFGGLSPLYPLIHGDFVGLDHNAALRFSEGGIYPTNRGDWREGPTHQCFAIAMLRSELISAGARETLHPVIKNKDTKQVPDNLFDYDTDSVTEDIESEVSSFAVCRTRPEPSEDTYRSRTLYWQPTSTEIDYPIELYNRFWSPRYRLRLPALRLFGPVEGNCHLSKVYIVVDDRDSAETIQELMTGLYHSGINSSSTIFSEQRLLDTNIIITNELPTTESRSLSIESIEQTYPSAIVKAVSILTVFDLNIDAKISEALVEAIKEGTNAAQNYFATHGDPEWVPCGGAWAETSEITHPVVQHMIHSGIAETLDGHAILSVRGLPLSQSQYQAEAAYTAVCETLSLRLGVCFEMYSYDD